MGGLRTVRATASDTIRHVSLISPATTDAAASATRHHRQVDDHGEWWIDVTDADIRSARTSFREARDRGDAPERVEALRSTMELLWGIQARQIARDFRRHRFADGIG